MRKMTKADCGEAIGLDELKSHLTKMLAAFAAFSESHGLRYYLSGGTLLGAVRHKGFIPWDDDIDINMPRPDCEKLMELSGGRIGRYRLVPPNPGPLYRANHWKLYDPGIVIENSVKGTSAKMQYHPAFIDIFPIEGLPDTEEANRRHYAAMTFAKIMLGCADSTWFHGRTLPAKLFHASARPFVLLTGRKSWFRLIERIARSIPYETADYVGVMMTMIHTTEERVLKREYEPQIEVSFEGSLYKAPAGYDRYLTQLYGPDYMLLPPPEKRKSHHDYKIYRRAARPRGSSV